MKALTAIVYLAWTVGMASLLAAGGIETSALSQPKWPIGEYRHPLQVKGTVRFITDFQQTARAIALPAMWGSMLVFLLAGVSYERIQKRRDSVRKSRSLDRLIRERGW